MLVDIQDWGFGNYRVWGLFNVPSDSIQRKVKSIFSYCSNLDAQSATIIFTSSNEIAGINHIFLASYFAAKAMVSKRNFAKDLGMELLLYLSRQSQIFAAMAKSGISDEQKITKQMWVVVFLAISPERLLAEKLKLETYLETTLLDMIGGSQPPLLRENPMESYQMNATHLRILEQMAGDIPRLPVQPVSMQEKALIHALIEKMVELSLDRVKLES